MLALAPMLSSSKVAPVTTSHLAQLRELGTANNRATAWVEHGTTFVGIDYGDMGRLVLGYGENFEAAMKAALIKNNG